MTKESKPTTQYVAQVMTREEFQKIAVPFQSIHNDLQSVMRDFGVAVVTNVLHPDEIAAFEKDFKHDLEELVDMEALQTAPLAVRAAYDAFSEKGPRAFSLRTTLCHLWTQTGLCLTRCLPHGRFAWRARRHPRVHAAFRELFPGCSAESLVTSLGAVFFTPEDHPPIAKSMFNAHSDQNKHDARYGMADRNIYQGVLYVWPALEDGSSSTTVVWPGSHLDAWSDMMCDPKFRACGAHGINYSEIRQMQNGNRREDLARRWQDHARRVIVPAGSLLLWDSRTLHTGWQGGPRLAQAVCLEPSGRRSEAERLAKLRLAAFGLPGCHWASAGIQHDLCRSHRGIFENSTVKARHRSGQAPDQIILPLKSCVWPYTLKPDANVDALRDFALAEHALAERSDAITDWSPLVGCRSLLESCVRDDIKRYL